MSDNFEPDIIIKHEPYKAGGITWGDTTILRTFKKTPLLKRIWLTIQEWWAE